MIRAIRTALMISIRPGGILLSLGLAQILYDETSPAVFGHDKAAHESISRAVGMAIAMHPRIVFMVILAFGALMVFNDKFPDMIVGWGAVVTGMINAFLERGAAGFSLLLTYMVLIIAIAATVRALIGVARAAF